MREKPRRQWHERDVKGCSAGIGRCSRKRCSREKRSVARRGRRSDGVVCAEQRLYSFSWKLLVKAFVLAKTLVVEFWEGDSKKSVFLSMDMDDLRSLADEVDRAKLKSDTVADEVSNWGVDLLTYGQQG